MNLKRSAATIAAGLLTGAAVLGFGLGTAEAEPEAWTAGAETEFTLAIPDEETGEITEIALAMDDGTFTGEIDDDAATITGEIAHGENEHSVSLGEGLDATLTGQLTIADIDLSWDADATDGDDNGEAEDETPGVAIDPDPDNGDGDGDDGDGDGNGEGESDPVDVAGTATVVFDLNSIVVALLGDDPIKTAPCTITVPAEVGGVYDGPAGELVIESAEMQLSPDHISGECGGLLQIVEPLFGNAVGTFRSTVSGDPREPGEVEVPEATDPETPAPAAPIATAPSYTG